MQRVEDHVREMQKRLRVASVFLIAATAVTFQFSSDILKWIQADLGYSLYALSAYETFYTKMMIAFLGGMLLSLPIILYEALKFIRPGLKDREYRVLRNYLPFSVILFVIGATFSYQFVVKTSLAFFESMTLSADVNSVWGLQNTIGFAIRLSTLAGIIFQLPIVATLLGKAGLVSSSQMKEYRSYFIVAILLFSALATPPDIVSQTLVTIPVIILYQISIYLVGKFEDSSSPINTMEAF